MKISVVIPTYKKVDQLVKNLQQNMPFLAECEVIVVNDDPDSSIDVLKQLYPGIVLVQNVKNLGFAGAVNTGIDKATGDYILLLNNDVLLHDNNYLKALPLFEQDTKLFAVGFAQQEKDLGIVGKNVLKWNDGFLQHTKADEMTPGFTGWAEGGAGLFDKKKLLELGLLDTLYSPFYWEDTDLGYRAWKHGFTILFEPSIIVEHHHESTISSFFSQNRIKTIAYRNQFFCVWTNITDKDLFNSHLALLPKWFIKMLLKGEFSFFSGFFQALSDLDSVKKKRAQKKLLAQKTDFEILNQFVTLGN